MGKRHHILVVDDDEAVTRSLALLLKQEGYRASTADSPAAALQILDGERVDLVLQDMNFTRKTTGEEGLELLARIKSRAPEMPVILITAWGSVELAVAGIKAGASDFITKPWTHEQITHALGTALGLARARRSLRAASPPTRAELDRDHALDELVGTTPSFVRALEIVTRVASTDASVLITGESGTGKELFARALWRNSARASGPFVAVNLAGIAPSLFESEVFGHVRGAFTGARSARAGRFEAAHGGTLFLDEVGDLDPSCQVKLLRVLQERVVVRVGDNTPRPVDVRVISATHRDLPAMIAEGRFREDLYYRLNLISLPLPALRERRADIPLLARQILHGIATRYGRPALMLSEDGARWLEAQPWPGNVRELKHLVERTALLSHGDEIDAEALAQAAESPAERAVPGTLPESMTLDEMERAMIVRALETHGGNLSRTAEALGLSRAALYRRLEKHGL